ncbi:hypothetical protein, partial [Haloferula sp.]|uniref:hypothetical protein n=1 Tax=Haloferula sp. TaxID=2497595 RepID=UPI003C71E7DD
MKTSNHPHTRSLSSPWSAIRAIRSLLITLAVSGSVGASPYPFVDDFESGSSSWSMNGLWSVSTERHASPTHALTDSHGSYYFNSSNASTSMVDDVDLSGAVRPTLSFQHSYSLEQYYDFGFVEVSTDGGLVWENPPLASFTGDQMAMEKIQIDLSNYAGESTLRLRFRLFTDSTVVRDGWTIDDVVIGEAPAPITLNAPSGADIGRNHIDLSWGASSDPNFAAYVIVRSLQPDTPWQDAAELIRITDPNQVTWTDPAISPKTHYHYFILVENTLGLRTPSNMASALTLPGMDYPFIDNGEGGPATWVADAPWALSEEDASSATHAWSDSPGADHANSLPGQSLTLSAPVDLSAATSPSLSFLHKYALGSGDSAQVEISTNGGTSWSTLATYTGASAGDQWLPVGLSLTSYKEPAVLVRFRLTTNASDVADGWHLDDISIAESPDAINTPLASQIASSSVRISWTASNHPQVVRYLVTRSATTGVGLQSTIAGEVAAGSPMTFVDMGLSLNTDYFYRVFAVTSYQAYSAPSPLELSVHTLSNPAPWMEDFENPLANWVVGASAGASTWAASDEDAQSGSRSLSDSPASSYLPDQNTWIETSVDLSDTEWPVLTFWDKLELGTGDWVRLEISATGYPSINVYGIYEGDHADWRQQRIDLARWVGSQAVKLRFRVVSNSDASLGEGWKLDSLSISENPDRNTPLTLPLEEDFEGDIQNRWIAASWHSDTDASAIDGTNSARSIDGLRMVTESEHNMVLDQALVLAPGSKVQATFWIRGELSNYGYFRLHYSINNGVSWTELNTVNRNNGYNSPNYERLQADLSSLAGKTVRLRFHTSASSYP